MPPDRRELHVHLGIDSVVEDLFENLFTQNILNAQNTDVRYVTAQIYRRELRDAVDNASIPVTQFPRQMAGHNLLLSRPRMIFPGIPLNCIGKGLQLAYKLKQLQHIFVEHKVCFHLFLTDHLSYLFHHQKYVASNSERAMSATWRPLIDVVLSGVFDGNELYVWNSEELTHFLPDFLQDVLNVSENDCLKVLNSPPGLQSNTPPAEALAKFRERFGLDQDHFDYVYEEELRELEIL
ncbi:hypothetical protein ACOTTU_16630 [Roseobacter sp. EG26]|uniref:hypothetical protein n=1 Tax=Roseobacter sp. EG26 TaxID=3412477 RepID=UPI003CE5B800